MVKVSRGRHIASRLQRAAPYPLPHHDQSEAIHKKQCSKALMRKDWEDATCSVCMEYPHNAVLLLCSSHDKGCRPYMCGTSFRFSNCLDQYRKAYTKVTSTHHGQNLDGDIDRPVTFPLTSLSVDKCEVTELACPLCRGQVKGWTVVEQARDYLNGKKRSCMQDCCSFIGTYKELRKHVKADHPSAKPREVDPLLEQKWRRLEREREREDVISTITSSMPGAVVFGDYVIEGGPYGYISDGDGAFDDDPIEQHDGFGVGIDRSFMLFLMRTINQAGNGGSNRGFRLPERNFNHASETVAVGSGRASPIRRYGYSDEDSGSDNGDGAVNVRSNNRMSLVRRLRNQGRVLLGHSGRRRRRREARNQRG